jgi:hypothetical protein
MDRLTRARRQLGAAAGLPAVLDAAYETFEAMLAVIRRHQDDDEYTFPAFVLSGNAAANGRDWIGEAPSIPPPARGSAPGEGLLDDSGVVDVALAVAALAQVLAARLAAAALRAADPQDRASCEHGAAHAGEIRDLLGGASEQ